MSSHTRREFVKHAALGAALMALPTSRALAANDRVRIGMIGVGGRGQDLLRQVQGVSNAELVAIADIYTRSRDQASIWRRAFRFLKITAACSNGKTLTA